MSREIAVFQNPDGSAASFDRPGILSVFNRRRRSWELDRERAIDLSVSQGLGALRRQMAEVLGFLGECRVLAAAGVTGVPYYELEKAGFTVWEVSGNPALGLDELWERDQTMRTKDEVRPEVKMPEATETEPGHFQISIKAVQESDLGVTSKQALQPVIRRGGFKSLTIQCGHVPPWLEGELLGLGYQTRTERKGPREEIVVVWR